LVSKCTIVGSLNDINLSMRRPVAGIREPQCRPCATPIRRVQDVEDEKTISVGIIRCDSHRLASTGRFGSTISCVYFEDGRCAIGVCKIEPLGISSADVSRQQVSTMSQKNWRKMIGLLNESICRISVGKIFKVVEKV
jgi:hypothetical protein